MLSTGVSHNYEYIPRYSNSFQQIDSERLILKIRQQPIQTRLSTNNERDRKPLDPPPIVQLEIDKSAAKETQGFLQNPYLFMCVSLVHSTTHEAIIHSTQNTLSGQTSSSMYKLKDINNQDGGFFVFGDLSVKLEGQFRLKFSIFEISVEGAKNLKSIYSNVFQVYPSKTFPGMLESTFLSRSFSDQGVRIRIRKEHRVQMTASRKRKLSPQGEALDGGRSSCNQQLYPSASNFASYPSSSVIHQRQRSPIPWLDHPHNSQSRRKSSITSLLSSGSDSHPLFYHQIQHIDRKPNIPFSPPHQPYDHHRLSISNSSNLENYYYEKTLHPHLYYQHRANMIPSPPPQTSVFIPDNVASSLNDTSLLRRQSAGPSLYHRPSETVSHHHLIGSRRLSLQQYNPGMIPPPPTTSTLQRHPSPLNNEEVIHLPPLRSIASNKGSIQIMSSSRKPQNGAVEVDAAVAMMQLSSRRQKQQKSASVN